MEAVVKELLRQLFIISMRRKQQEFPGQLGWSVGSLPTDQPVKGSGTLAWRQRGQSPAITATLSAGEVDGEIEWMNTNSLNVRIMRSIIRSSHSFHILFNSTILKALNGSYWSFITLAILMPLMGACERESHTGRIVCFRLGKKNVITVNSFQ